MSEKRTKRYIGELKTVLYYPNGGFPNIAVRMMATPDEPTGRGQFFFDGTNIHFHEDDSPYEKCIVYDSVQQVQRTTRRSKKVRLRP